MTVAAVHLKTCSIPWFKVFLHPVFIVNGNKNRETLMVFPRNSVNTDSDYWTISAQSEKSSE